MGAIPAYLCQKFLIAIHLEKSCISQAFLLTFSRDLWSVPHPEVKNAAYFGHVTEIGSEYEFVKSDNEILLPVKLVNLKCFTQNTLPKLKINQYLEKNKKIAAKYKHIEQNGLFKSQLQLGDKIYSSALWNRSKKLSDNAAALVYLKSLETFGNDTWVYAILFNTVFSTNVYNELFCSIPLFFTHTWLEYIQMCTGCELVDFIWDLIDLIGIFDAFWHVEFKDSKQFQWIFYALAISRVLTHKIQWIQAIK